jgi:diguanylate cyclase (GGDEF)-like protein/PAS domain S-box-containing protein
MKPEQREGKKAAQETLAPGDSRFSAIATLLPDGLIIIDSKQRIVFFNPGAEQLFGFTRQEAIGQPIDLLIPHRFIDRHAHFVSSFIASAVTTRHLGDGKREFFGRHKSGMEFPVDLSITKWESDRQLFLAALVKNISDRIRSEQMIHRLAYYDSLSGLPSRFQFIEKLDQLIREAGEKSESIDILVVDVLRFKEINQALGSNLGDSLIKGAAQRIIETIGENDIAARIGGDTFGIILSPDSGGAESCAEAICVAMRKPFQIDSFPVVAEVTVGIAKFPEQARTAEGLIQKCEIALLDSKRSGSDYSVYDPKKDPFINSMRLTLLAELAQAIESGQLFLLYQPKIDLQNGKVVGVETLIRWKHPTKGIILPSEFVSPAENTDLIKNLTLFVIRESLKQFKTLFNLGRNLGIGVNISTRNLHDPLLPGKIVQMLTANKITPHSLELEITENAIMAQSEYALNAITLLERAGINLAIDEFGIGYSSLNILKKLPIRSVKIPRIFIKDLATNREDLKIVQSIITLAHTLELKVTAVGVEDKIALKKLIELGCDTAQGNYMSPPVPIKEVFGLLYKPLDNWI